MRVGSAGGQPTRFRVGDDVHDAHALAQCGGNE